MQLIDTGHIPSFSHCQKTAFSKMFRVYRSDFSAFTNIRPTSAHFRLPIAFISRFNSPCEHVSSLRGKAISSGIDRSIRRKVITFRKYRPVFANRLRFHRSLDVSQSRLPRILFCRSAFFLFPSLSLSVCLSLSLFLSFSTSLFLSFILHVSKGRG